MCLRSVFRWHSFVIQPWLLFFFLFFFSGPLKRKVKSTFPYPFFVPSFIIFPFSFFLHFIVCCLKELKLKDEECERLSKVRDQLGQELEELTASLFEVCFHLFGFFSFLVKKKKWCVFYYVNWHFCQDTELLSSCVAQKVQTLNQYWSLQSVGAIWKST